VADLAVLIPALNCEGTIAAVVAGARRFTDTVLVVDDGSGDDTAPLARGAGADVLSYDVNRGKGAALLDGMRHLAARGVRRVLTMDADGQHLAEEIPVLVEASDREPRALIVGARRVESEPVAAINLFGNRFANRWVEIACGQAIDDTQSGFRVYPLAEILALPLRARHFGFETEVLIRAARAGVRIRSVPVRVYYPPPEERVSHYRKVVDTTRIVFIVIGLMLRVW